MKKIFLILAVLMLAAPVMAEPNNITITATQVSSAPPAEVEITYTVTSGKIPRAFALDITVTVGNIVDVGNFFVGECNDSNGYGIFPASFNRYINPASPNWADVNVNYTPVAEPNDLVGGTQPGIGFGGVTIEMGSLYAAPKGPPEDSGILCSIFVDSSCHVDLALNVGRAGIVLEDGNPPDNIAWNECDVTVVCTVPSVVGDANLIAQVAIFGAGFGIGDITTNCSDTIADGNVISQSIVGEQTCGADVDLVISTGQPTVPDVLAMNEAAAIAAINAVAYISAGAPTYECNEVEAAGEVLSQSPDAGVASCGTTVDLVVSKGPPPTVPNVLDMNEADAIAAINAVANLSVGTVSYDCNNSEAADEVLSQTPGAGPAACDATVDIVVSTGQPTVPDVLDMNETEAIAAINAVAYISAGTPTYECNDVEAAGEVLSQTPGAGSASCGTTVDIVVSTGPCAVPCPGDVTGIATGYHAATPFDPAYFDANDWTGPDGKTDTTDVQALIYLLEYTGVELVVTPVPAYAAAGDVTEIATGYHAATPFDPAYFDANDWTGPDGKIDTTDVQALTYLLEYVGVELVYTCP